jgi:hypothetical protein
MSIIPEVDPLFCFTSNTVEIHPCLNCHAPMTLISGIRPSLTPTYARSIISTAIVLTGDHFLEVADLSDPPERVLLE